MKGLFRLFIFVFLLADAAIAFVWWTHPKGARKMGYSGEIPFEPPFKLPYDIVVKKPAAPPAAGELEKPAAPRPRSVTEPVGGQFAGRPDRPAPGKHRVDAAPQEKPVRMPKHPKRRKTKEELELEALAEDVGVELPEDKRLGLTDEEESGLLDQPFDNIQ